MNIDFFFQMDDEVEKERILSEYNTNFIKLECHKIRMHN